eukprot:CAMPEP_0176310270 /NCGR_PEP_ID=MMETSP0121_2-20121125/65514_1 /TAXON_ID=160619 /ORGANISM="Kryptoperidinium foliaceum, Strain CCMP 1326" /LENGTH=150 /DNA_ID=CAMNT_0017652211 /DNA_START=28 /DNA_END=477 /DNA_ORIENTATION=-
MQMRAAHVRPGQKPNGPTSTPKVRGKGDIPGGVLERRLGSAHIGDPGAAAQCSSTEDRSRLARPPSPTCASAGRVAEALQAMRLPSRAGEVPQAEHGAVAGPKGPTRLRAVSRRPLWPALGQPRGDAAADAGAVTATAAPSVTATAAPSS